MTGASDDMLFHIKCLTIISFSDIPEMSAVCTTELFPDFKLTACNAKLIILPLLSYSAAIPTPPKLSADAISVLTVSVFPLTLTPSGEHQALIKYS